MESRFMLTAGEIDHTFGEGGASLFGTTGPSSDAIGDVVRLADGRYVAVGVTNDAGDADFALARFNADGSPDETFGLDGRVTTHVGKDDGATAVTALADGTLVVGGYVGRSLAVAQYRPDGSLDESFGDGGIVIEPPATLYDLEVNDIAVDTDGRVTIAAGASGVHVLRYRADGSRDTSFSEDGLLSLRTSVGHGGASFGAIELVADGKIVVGGTGDSTDAYSQWSFWRLNPDGSLDAGFADGGQLRAIVAQPQATLRDLTVHEDAIVAVGGGVTRAAQLLRVTAAGELDPTFGKDGTASFSLPMRFYPRSVASDADGRLLIGGAAYAQTPQSTVTDWRPAVARVSPAGALDLTFDADGFATSTALPPDASLVVSRSVVPNPDGSIVIGGGTLNDGQRDLALTRFDAQGREETEFVHPVGFPGHATDSGADVVVQPDGKIISVGASAVYGSDVAQILVFRHNPDGTLDPSFGDGGHVKIGFGASSGATSAAVRLLADGRILIGGTVMTRFGTGWDPDAILVRLLPDGRTDPTFGKDGRVRLNWAKERVRDIALQPDGKVVLVGAGATGLWNSDQVFAARVNEDGTVDGTFGTAGRVLLNLYHTASAAAVQSDGKILLVGYSGLIRLNADGTRDTAFGDGSQTTYPDYTDVMVDAADRIYAVDKGFAVTRYTSGGIVDATFGQNGKTSAPYSAASNTYGSAELLLDSAGRFVVGGTLKEYSSFQGSSAVARFLPNGAIDWSFGSGGKASIKHSDRNEGSFAGLALEADDDLIVLDHEVTGAGNNIDLSLVRVQGRTALAADAGGPYVVAGGGTIALVASAATDSKYWISSYEWDFDYGGDPSEFSADATGSRASFSAASIVGPATRSIALRVKDSGGNIVVIPTAVTVVPPRAEVRFAGGPAPDPQGRYTISLGYGDDMHNPISGVTIDWGDGTVEDIDGTPATASHAYASGRARHEVSVTVRSAGGTYDATSLVRAESTFDPAFGVAGLQRTDFDADAQVVDAAVNADGLYLVLSKDRLARYRADGTLDATFGDGGSVVLDFSGNSLAFQGDGQILVGGAIRTQYGGGWAAVARFRADGTRDLVFGTNGVGLTSITSNPYFPATRVAVLPDGRILLSDTNRNQSHSAHVAVLRQDGVIDRGFGTNGQVEVSFGQYFTLHDVAFAPDGRVALLGGLGNGTVELKVLRADGKPETTFDADGSASFRIGSQGDVVQAAAFQPDGKLLLAGRISGASYSGGFDGVVARLDIDGSFDASFGTGGTTTFGFDGTQEQFHDVTTDRAGRIIVGGTAEGFANKLSLIARFLPDGAADTSFGDGGAFVLDASPTGTEVVTKVIALPSGQVLAVGHSDFGEDHDHVAARFGDARLLVSVGNEAPSITADDLVFAPALPGEMQTFTLSGSFEDADPSDAHTVTIDWGDGSPATVIELPAGQRSFSADHVAPDDKPAGSPEIGRLITVSVSDGLATTSATKRLAIRENRAPVVDLGPDLVSGEHDRLTITPTVTDAAGETFTYQWNVTRADGGPISFYPPQNGPTLIWQPRFVGRYTISVTVMDDGQVAGTDSVVVDVVDQAPVASIVDVVTVDENKASRLEPGWLVEPVKHAWRVLDASGAVLGTSANSAYHFRAPDNSEYTAELTVTDDDGNSVTTTKPFTVLNSPPVATVVPNVPRQEGGALTATVTWTDGGVADTHTVLWRVKDATGRTVHTSSESTLSYVPSDDGWHTVTLTVTDDDGGSDTEFLPLRVANVAPQITLAGDPIREGTPYTLAWTVEDPGADTITSWTIDWGDGTPPQVLGGSARSAAHTYPDGHKQVTIKVTAADEDGSHVVTSQRSVLNVPPLVTIDAPETIGKGEPYFLRLSADDPGADLITRWTVNWGDGTAVTTVNIPANTPTTGVGISHTYAGTGRYQVKITTTDEDGTSPTVVRELFINGGTPFTFSESNVLVPSGSIPENSASYLDVWFGGDANMYELTVDWGDGSPLVEMVVPRGNPRVKLNHHYLDDPKTPDDRYEIVVTAYNGRETKTVREYVTVTNVRPQLNAGPDDVSIVETASVKLTAPRVTDRSPLDVITYWWEVADEGGKVLASGPGTELTFTAPDDGIYNAALSISDDDGGNRWLPFVITASNVRPTLSARASGALVRHGETLTLDLSAGGDIGPDTLASWLIDWGDGSPVQTLAGDARTASHVYTSGDGLLPIVVRATDEDGTYGVPVSGVSSAGILDPSFADAGKSMLSVPGYGYAAAHDVVIQPDGMAVVAAAARDASGAADAVLLRYNADGTLDTSFGTDGDGIVRVRLDQRHSEGLSVALAPDGKIVMAGRTWAAGEAERRAFVARLNANGTPDLSFGGAGDGRTAPLPETTQVRRVQVLPDGRIVLGVRRHSPVGVDEIGIVRLSAGGTLDTSFGSGGFASVWTSILSDFEVAPDGRIVVAHESYYGGTVSRLNADGSRDWSFGYAGLFQFNWSWPTADHAVAVALLPDGRVLVAAHQSNQLTVVRLESHGVPDVTFGDGGRVAVPVSNNLRLMPSSMVLDDADRAIIAGTVTSVGSVGQSLGLLRITSDGVIDSTFGTSAGAPVTARFTDTFFERAAAVEIDGDRIWAVGVSERDAASTTASLVAARFMIGAIGVEPGQIAVAAGKDATLGVGSTLTRGGSFSAAGQGATLTATVDYGDGGGEQPLPLNPDNTFSLGHRYQSPGAYVVSVEVSDGSGIPGVATFTVVVRDASFHGSIGDDTFRVRLSADRSAVEFFENVEPDGEPTFVLPAAGVAEILIRPSLGNDRFIIESGTFAVSSVQPEMDNLTLVLNGNAAATLTRDQSFQAIEIDNDARLTLTPGTTMRLGYRAISLAGNGTLDLRGGAVRITVFGDGPPSPIYVANVEQWVRSARESGSARWAGPGITSSTAALDDVAGVVVVPVGNELVVRHSYNGDANGDGRINADDYFAIDSGFIEQPANPLYAQGDFNYDDKINADDYFLIDSAFLGQGEPLASSTPATATPATSTATRTFAAEPQQERERKRPVRSIFSDQPMSVLGASRRQSVVRRR